MNWLDVAIIVLIAGSVIGSFWRGFSRDFTGLVASIAALLLALWFYGTAAEFFRPFTSTKGVASFLGFLVIFFGVFLCGAVAGKMLNRFFATAGLSWMDRLLGAGFGFLRGVLFAGALVMLLMAFTPGIFGSGPPRSVIESRFAPHVVSSARLMAAIAPYEVKEGFRKSYDRLKQIWRNAVRKQARELPTQEL